MSGIQEIETPRLRLRGWTLDDLDAAFSIFGDPEVMRYVGTGRPVGSRQTLGDRMESRIAAAEDGREPMWAVVDRESGHAIGNCGFSIFLGGPEMEIEFHLARKAWGRGLATEAAAAGLAHAFDLLDRDRILGVTRPENRASRRVLEKTGFGYDGLSGCYFDNDVAVYSLDRPGRDTKRTVRISRVARASPDRAFRAFTDPGELSTWFTRNARVEPTVGGAYANDDGDRGTFLTVVPPERLRFTWEHPEHAPGTRVAVRLGDAEGSRVRIDLAHEGLDTADQERDLREGWEWALDSLRSYLETGTPVRHENWLRARKAP